jgi:hypothetical protein
LTNEGSNGLLGVFPKPLGYGSFLSEVFVHVLAQITGQDGSICCKFQWLNLTTGPHLAATVCAALHQESKKTGRAMLLLYK